MFFLLAALLLAMLSVGRLARPWPAIAGASRPACCWGWRSAPS